jgi:hypothetical protein
VVLILAAHIMPSTPKQRSWLQGEAPYVRSGLSDFECVASWLKLSPEQYESSGQLRQWVEKNWQQKFVPESLLKAWGPQPMAIIRGLIHRKERLGLMT